MHFSRKSKRGGFSLPEVAIAVAIAATGLVTLLGIIPSGLDSVKAAGENTSSARIASQVIGEIQLSDWGSLNGQGSSAEWSNLKTLFAKRWYYDDQANQISGGAVGPAMEMRLAYVVRVRPAQRPVYLPGSTDANSNMTAILIDIANATSANFEFKSDRTYKTYPAVVSRQYSKS